MTTYLKWLLRGGVPWDGMGRQMAAVLERLDAIGVAIANLPRPSGARPDYLFRLALTYLCVLRVLCSERF